MRPTFVRVQIAVWSAFFAATLAAALLWWSLPLALVDRGLLAVLGLALTSAWRPVLRRATGARAVAALVIGGGVLGGIWHALHQTLVAATFDTWSVVGLWRHGVPKLLATAPFPVATMLAWGAAVLAARRVGAGPDDGDTVAEADGPETAGGAEPAYPARFVVREASRVVPVAVEALRWVEADGDYVRLHTRDGRSVLHRQTMAATERQLDPAVFVRIHRSAIVRTAAVREVRRLSRGEAEAVLDDGTVRRIGRAYRSAFDARVTG